ncbi:AAA family ATPase [Lysobacter changpingensis]|uniref:AAA family ATPase n=1 Tax=Lysobacter changpingensis TaxID=2792784 RepID=UPI001A8DAEE0
MCVITPAGEPVARGYAATRARTSRARRTADHCGFDEEAERRRHADTALVAQPWPAIHTRDRWRRVDFERAQRSFERTVTAYTEKGYRCCVIPRCRSKRGWRSFSSRSGCAIEVAPCRCAGARRKSASGRKQRVGAAPCKGPHRASAATWRAQPLRTSSIPQVTKPPSLSLVNTARQRRCSP